MERNYQGATDSGLTGSSWNASVENNLDEYDYTNDFSAHTDLTTYRGAPEVLGSFKALLAKPWITHVEWAQFQDPVCPTACDVIGLLDQGGHKRATYNAYQLYARMPVDRKKLTVSGAVDGMASSDAHTSSVVLWNTSGADQTVSTALQHVPFVNGNFRVYRIDAQHASYGDDHAHENLTAVEERRGTSTSGLTWNGTIPDHGVVYLEAEDGTGTTALNPTHVADVVRDLVYDPNHGKSSWASFDRNTWTAQLGMGAEDFADAETGVVATGLPSTLRVRFAVQGAPRVLDANSALAMRVDYATSSGYTKGVVFSSGTYDTTRSAPVPWGTQRRADQVVGVNLADFSFNPGSYAPAGWTGRVTISCIMQNVGAGTRAAIRTTSGS